jgi:VWFA-related protein
VRALCTALLVAGLVSAATRAQAPGATAASGSAVKVAITSPEAGTYVTGATQLKAEITPAPAVDSVSFFVEGREVCAMRKPPFTCSWDAGKDAREWQIRLSVTWKDGSPRTIRTLRTKGLDFADSAEVDAVQVTVTVTNDGKFVQGLPRSAFHVWEDGRPQTISSFVSEDVPLELIVAIDVSSSMTEAMPKAKEAVKKFFGAVPQSNPVSLFAFNDTFLPVTRKSTDLAERVRAVDRLSAWGATALYDAIAQAVETLGQQVGRKALVIFSDGEDQGSHLTIEETEQRLQASDVTLYMIGQGRGLSAEPLKKIMQRLAEPTGGRAISTDSIDKLQGAFEELLVELSHQYLIGYQSTNSARDGSWRELKVEVDGSGRVRARKGYRAAQAKR